MNLPPKFLLLYTKDLRKKHKNWVDGFGRLFKNGKLCLYSSEEDRLLDSQFIKPEDLDSGEPIQLDRHLVEIETPLQFVGSSGRSISESSPPGSSKPFIPQQHRRSRAAPAPQPSQDALKKVRSANEILSLFAAPGEQQIQPQRAVKKPRLAQRVSSPSSSEQLPSSSSSVPRRGLGKRGRAAFRPPRQVPHAGQRQAQQLKGLRAQQDVDLFSTDSPSAAPFTRGQSRSKQSSNRNPETRGFSIRGPLEFSESPTRPEFPYIPDRFEDLKAYSDCFSRALLAELQGQINKLSRQYFTLRRRLIEGTNLSPAAMQATFRRHNIPFYHSEWLQLQILADQNRASGSGDEESDLNSGSMGGRESKRRRRDDKSPWWKQRKITPQSCRVWLKLTGNVTGTKERSAAYSKDDIWILSSNSSFSGTHPDWIGFFRSEYYGFSSRSMMLISPLVPHTLPIPAHEVSGKHRASLSVFGIRVLPQVSELSLLDTLGNISSSSLPLAPTLFQGSVSRSRGVLPSRPSSAQRTPSKGPDLLLPKLKVSVQQLEAVRAAHLTEWHLNQDQIQVLDRCLRWFNSDFRPGSGTEPRAAEAEAAVLVHGSFGAGKTFLLTSIAICMSRILDEIDPDKHVRILVSSLSNVAVDNVLLSLLRYQFRDFRRVGSAKRIAKPILDFTIHHRSEAPLIKHQLDQTQRELKKAITQGNIQKQQDCQVMIDYLRSVFADLSSRPVRKQRSSSSSSSTRQGTVARIIGTTCASSVSAALDGAQFAITLLDECSQMTEPLSFQTISRFHVERFLCVGDPLQLLPTLPGHPEISKELMESPDQEPPGLYKTLFVRLQRTGLQPIFLHTQYRCHPVISRIANDMFYGGRLLDGVSAADRAAVLSNGVQLPPFLFCNVPHGQEAAMFGFGDSVYNEAEADLVARLVSTLLQLGIPAGSIGIIALYRAQAHRIRQLLSDAQDRVIGMSQTSSSLKPQVPPPELVGALEADSAGGGGAMAADEEDAEGGDSQLADVIVSTVDAFQGAEKDIIILSCCRTRSSDFIDNPQRMNVALTRARRHLLILGHERALSSSGGRWSRVISYSRRIPRSFQPNPDKLLSLLGSLNTAGN